MTDIPGTVRRAPAPSFAHAIAVEQSDGLTWEIVDVYGSMMEFYYDNEVDDWPVVYTPVSDDTWEKVSKYRQED